MLRRQACSRSPSSHTWTGRVIVHTFIPHLGSSRRCPVAFMCCGCVAGGDDWEQMFSTVTSQVHTCTHFMVPPPPPPGSASEGKSWSLNHYLPPTLSGPAPPPLRQCLRGQELVPQGLEERHRVRTQAQVGGRPAAGAVGGRRAWWETEILSRLGTGASWRRRGRGAVWGG